MYDICVGQKLVCLNGEKVIVNRITEAEIIVEYKNKLYRRSKDIIGHKLLLQKYEEQPKISKTSDYSKEYEHDCKDCMVLRRGDCFGEKKLCSFFVASPKVTKEEMDNWPKYGDATYYRMTSRK